MPLPVEDQFPEADASASAQASSSSSSAQPPRPKISDPKHLSSLLDMLADGEGDDDEGNPAGTSSGPGGIQVEEIESEDEDEVEQGEEGKVEGVEGVGASTSKSKKKKKNKKKNKSSKTMDQLKWVARANSESPLSARL